MSGFCNVCHLYYNTIVTFDLLKDWDVLQFCFERI